MLIPWRVYFLFFRKGAEKQLKLMIRIDYSVTSWKTDSSGHKFFSACFCDKNWDQFH